MIALDTETMLIEPGLLAPPLVCVSWADDSGRSGLLHHADPELQWRLRQALAEHTVWHNAPFDLLVLAVAFPELLTHIYAAYAAGRIHDTGIRQRLLDINGSGLRPRYSLSLLHERHFGAPLEKDQWRLTYADRWGVPLADWPAGARDYAVGDAVATLAIYSAQGEAHVFDDEPAQCRADWALHCTSARGLRTDPAAIDKLEARTLEQIASVREQLVEVGLVRADGTRDTKAAQSRMAEVERFPARTDTGRISVSTEACEATDDPTLHAYARFQTLTSLRNGTIKDLRKGVDRPVQARYTSLIATGRTSSSAPNIQNIRTRRPVCASALSLDPVTC